MYQVALNHLKVHSTAKGCLRSAKNILSLLRILVDRPVGGSAVFTAPSGNATDRLGIASSIFCKSLF